MIFLLVFFLIIFYLYFIIGFLGLIKEWNLFLICFSDSVKLILFLFVLFWKYVGRGGVLLIIMLLLYMIVFNLNVFIVYKCVKYFLLCFSFKLEIWMELEFFKDVRGMMFVLDLLNV